MINEYYIIELSSSMLKVSFYTENNVRKNFFANTDFSINDCQ